MKSKTAMTELKEFLHTWTSLDGERLVCTVEYLKENVEKLLAKSNQEIIDAYCAGCKNSGLHKTHEEKATDYFTQKYKQQ